MKYFKNVLKVLFLSLFVLGLLAACSGPTHFYYVRVPTSAPITQRHIHVYINKEFTAEDKLHIDDAILRWNYALNNYIVMTVINYSSSFTPIELMEAYSSNGLLIYKVDSNHPNIPPQRESRLRTIAWTDRLGGNEIFLIRDRLYLADIYPVMLHELGHFLGANHVNEMGLMNKEYSATNYNCIDKSTVRQVAKFQKVDFSALNYCVF